MAHVLIENGIVTQKQPNPQDGFVEAPAEVVCGWTWDGQTFSKPPAPAIDPLQVQADTTVAIQTLLDTTAQAHGYDGIVSVISYVGSSIPKWDAEGTRAKAWRDECWWKGYLIQEATKAALAADPAAPIPTKAEVLAQMPPANWPAGA